MLVTFIFILSWSVKPLVNSLIYSFFSLSLSLFLGFLDSSSLKNHTLAGVFCVKASQGEDRREWSISPNLISCIPPPPPPPTPLVTMPLCAAPTSLVPSLLQPTCEMLFCCLVPPQLEHLPLDPTPLCFSSIQPKQRLVLSATLCRLFSEDKQERETDRGCRGQWNSWLDWSSSFSISTFLMSYVSKWVF